MSSIVRTAWKSSFIGPTVGYLGKRELDLIVAASALCLLLPLFAAIALAIRLTSPGPILFRQRRIGLQEVPFTILKFRSMRTDAESTGPKYTVQGDPRITVVGHFLRRTSLDELPQLINVLIGDMSLFGPRPFAGFELDDWSPEQRRQRASVRPGISGLAQVNGRSGLTSAEVRHWDLEYVDKCSASLDARLLVRTLVAVLGRKGTN